MPKAFLVKRNMNGMGDSRRLITDTINNDTTRSNQKREDTEVNANSAICIFKGLGSNQNKTNTKFSISDIIQCNKLMENAVTTEVTHQTAADETYRIVQLDKLDDSSKNGYIYKDPNHVDTKNNMRDNDRPGNMPIHDTHVTSQRNDRPGNMPIHDTHVTSQRNDIECSDSNGIPSPQGSYNMEGENFDEFPMNTSINDYSSYLVLLNINDKISNINKHRCEVCFKWFQRTSSLSNHRLIHKNDKSFKCKQCNTCFLRKSDLEKHIHIHSGLKPYECDTCGKRFSQSSNMLTHQRRHSGIRPFPCSLCGKRFYRKVDVRRHATIHKIN